MSYLILLGGLVAAELLLILAWALWTMPPQMEKEILDEAAKRMVDDAFVEMLSAPYRQFP